MMALLKFFLIVFIFFFIISKVFGFIFRALFSTSGRSTEHFERYRTSNRNQNNQKTQEGNIRVDYNPDGTKKGNKDFKGGEYIDYEEVD